MRFRTLTVALLGILLAACSTPPKDANGETPHPDIERALLLSKDAKRFARSLDILPSSALSRGDPNGESTTLYIAWIESRGRIALWRAPEGARSIFQPASGVLPTEITAPPEGKSLYWRRAEAYAGDGAEITPGFAALSREDASAIIIHEDLHDPANFDLPWETEEAVITPLGYLAAHAFHESRGEHAEAGRLKEKTERMRIVARSLMSFADEAERLSRDLPPDAAHAVIRSVLSRHPPYATYVSSRLDGQDPDVALEALISENIQYWRWFDRIIALHEISGDLTRLVQDLKRTPGDLREADGYLRELEMTYRIRGGTKGP